MRNKIKVLMFIGNGVSSNIMHNAIIDKINICKVVTEKKPSRYSILKRRIIKLGILKVLGQVLFLFYNKLILSKKSSNRISEIINENKLNINNIPTERVLKVNSINDNEVKKILLNFRPDIVIVNGTRIISKEILNVTNAKFINTHMGITPKYRGVHGGFWAVANNDFANCGVTVHFVDEGIDTGNILYQDIIDISTKDDYNTFPYLQIAKAIPLMLNAVNDISHNNYKTIKRKDLASKLWSHPTILDYFRFNIKTRSLSDSITHPVKKLFK